MKHKKCLIAYFSRKGNNYLSGKIVNLAVGNTEVAAKMIQELAGGELFHIEAVNPYPEDYTETTEVAKRELQENARPELTALVKDISSYDVIFLGYPNWWNTFPMPVFSFLEQYNLAGKTIAPFCTHEGSRLGRSERDIATLCPHAQLATGLALHGTQVSGAKATIEAWIKNIGLLG